MYWRFLAVFVLILFALYGCTPGAPDSTPPPSSPAPADSSPAQPPDTTGPQPGISTPAQPPAETPSQPADSTPVPSPETEPPVRPSPSDRVPRISPAELLQKMLNNEDILIVDSRAEVEQEYENGHITGAIPVPLSQITSGQWEPPADKNKEIVFYCT